MTMKVSYHIDAPVEKVFKYFKNPNSGDGTFGMKVLEAKATKEGVGTYMAWQVRLAGIPLRGLDVFTDFAPNRHITEKSSSAMVGTWDYSFEPEGTGTRLTMEHRPRAIWAVPPLSNVVDAATAAMSRAYIGQVRSKLEKGQARETKKADRPRKSATPA